MKYVYSFIQILLKTYYYYYHLDMCLYNVYYNHVFSKLENWKTSGKLWKGPSLELDFPI